MKSSRSSKSATAGQATPAIPRLSLFDAKGKVKTVDAQALRIDFPDGRSLMFDLSDSSGDAASRSSRSMPTRRCVRRLRCGPSITTA